MNGKPFFRNLHHGGSPFALAADPRVAKDALRRAARMLGMKIVRASDRPDKRRDTLDRIRRACYHRRGPKTGVDSETLNVGFAKSEGGAL